MALRAAHRIALVLAAAGTIAACGGAVASSGGGGAGGGGAAGGRGVAGGGRHDVVVLTETRGFHHASIPWAVQALKRIATRDGRYTLTFMPCTCTLTPALRHASAVVLLLTSGELPLDAAGKQALLSFVRHGGGLVGFHSATDTFHRWPGFIRLIGAEFSHHPVPSVQNVIVEDRRNPATMRLPARLAIKEEFYVFKHDPRPGAHVLARLDTGPHGPDRPLVWCKRAGAGRVFYDALGHFPQTWQDSRQVALVSGGIAWALGLASGPC